MSGRELRKLAESIGATALDVCVASDGLIRSQTTVNKVYNERRVSKRSKAMVEQAIKRLAAKQAVAG